jgi:hypothetical protein
VFVTTGGAAGFGPGDRLAALFPGAWKDNRGPLIQVEPGREYHTLVAGAGAGMAFGYLTCSLHPEGRLLAVGTEQGVSLLDLATGGERAFLQGRCPNVLFEPSGALVTNGVTGLLRWPVQVDPQAPYRLRIGPPDRIPIPAPVDRLACSSLGTVLAGATVRDGAFVWHRDRPQQALHLKPHLDCRTVAVSPDGKLVATGAHNARGLKVWDADTGALVRELLPDAAHTWPSFSSDGSWLFNVAGQSWRVRDWTEGPRHPTGVVACAPPELRLAACNEHKGFIPLINPETGRELARLEDPHQDGVLELTFSRDGTLLIGPTNDSSCVRVWDLRKIRQGLVELGLDWVAPPYPPAKAPAVDGLRPVPLEVEILGAEAMIAAIAAADRGKKALALNNQAWRLVTGPAKVRDPAKALPLARQAVELAPDKPTCLNTLGVVLYRNGQFKEAISTLEKSLNLGKGQFDGFDLYFLAMCHAQLGDAAKARDCFDRAVRWGEGQKDLPPQSAAELTEFRAEAESELQRKQKSKE